MQYSQGVQLRVDRLLHVVLYVTECPPLLLLVWLLLYVDVGAVAGAVSSLQSSFDATVATLRSTQLQLAVDLKAAAGRLLMMLKELTLLKVGGRGVCVWGGVLWPILKEGVGADADDGCVLKGST
jgi:hypothetical protein